MMRSVTVETHNETTEQPTLFDAESPPRHDYLRFHIRFEFRENDTMVYQKLLCINTAPRDWHFKSRLIDLIKKEITGDDAFQFTKWNRHDSFSYSFHLFDSPGILSWMKKKEALRLFGAY